MKVSPIVAMASVVGSGVGMFAISWLASRCLSPLELGYLLAFLSFGTFMQMADFGLSYASLIAGGTCVAPEKAGELSALAGFVTRFNVLVSCASLAIVGIFGTRTFMNAAQGPGIAAVNWEWPWVFFLLGIFAVQLSVPGMSLREGSGKPNQMWRLRLIQEMAGVFACVAALLLGGRLWSISLYALARAIVIGFCLRFGHPIEHVARLARFSSRRWFTENWSFQWRVGLSSLSGFLIFRAVTPIVFSAQGPVAGGQYGLALSVMNLLFVVMSAWPMSQTAHYASVLAANKQREFDREISRTLVLSTMFAALAAATGYLAICLAKSWGLAFAVRMAEPKICAILLACAVVHHVNSCLAVFSRAEGRDPLWILSTVGGGATVVALWLAARWGSLTAVAATQLIMPIIGVPIAVLIYLAHRKRRPVKTDFVPAFFELGNSG